MIRERSPAVIASIAAVVLFLLAGGAPRALADMVTYDITAPNTALSGYPSPYATVTITVTGGVATVKFMSDTTSGYTYLMGDSSSVDLNLSQSGITASGFSWTGGNNKTAFTSAGAGQVDGFGNFNLTINDFDGFTSAVTEVMFTLSGTWGSAADVLAANGNGAFAAIHAYASGNGCTGACVTGYAANGGAHAPEASSVALTSLVLLAFGAALVRARRNALA
jgi:hypothetical protein